MQLIYTERCLEYSSPEHPESPDRVAIIADHLDKAGYLFIEPDLCQEEDIRRVHSAQMLDRVKQGTFMDADTPALPNIFYYASRYPGNSSFLIPGSILLI